MDRRERIGNEEEEFKLAFGAAQSNIWTALPGIIQSFNAVAMTCTVQPSVSGTVRAQDGTFSSINLPILLDCPVFFPSGGGCTLTFPVKAGDECLVVFASRCIDAWWQLGGVQGQAEFRMHNLSDGFALPGVRSQPRVLSGVSTASVQLRSDDGVAFMDINPATHQMTLTAPNVAINGNVAITGTLSNNGKAVGSTHTHGGVQTGGGTTGAPT